ncbi:MAG: sulfotransferase [Pseudomonadota bacterium]
MAHPLYGADIGTILTVMGRSGFPSKGLEGSGILASALGRAPVSLAEKLIMDPRLPTTDEMAPPVFILGHWRSGTTHLYNIMTKGGQWGYVPPVATGLPWDLFGIAKIFNPVLERALPSHRYIDKIPVHPDSPQEDEIAVANMSPLSFYHGIYFPRDFQEHLQRGLFFDGCSPAAVKAWEDRFVYLMRKLYVHQGRKPLLIKNPVYTGRLATLRRLFPAAKFIHIHRNPYDVFRSMQNFYAKLLQQFALQSYDHVDIDAAILSVYPRMMNALEADQQGLRADQFVEVGYDALDHTPMETVRHIYTQLGLPDFDEAAPAFEGYLASIKSFEKNQFDYPQANARQVENHWGAFLEKWDYQRPRRARQPGPVGSAA